MAFNNAHDYDIDMEEYGDVNSHYQNANVDNYEDFLDDYTADEIGGCMRCISSLVVLI
jgi:hypothetical protein